jgi:hypothetical protein
MTGGAAASAGRRRRGMGSSADSFFLLQMTIHSLLVSLRAAAKKSIVVGFLCLVFFNDFETECLLCMVKLAVVVEVWDTQNTTPAAARSEEIVALALKYSENTTSN